jgi:hypothetical protein
VKWLGCNAGLDLVTGNGNETNLHYSVTLYSNGDVEVGCNADLGTAQNGAGYQYYPSTTTGSSTGGCFAAYDLNSGGTVAGLWYFKVSTGSKLVATYQDEGDSHNGTTYTFKDADCNAYATDSSGEWVQSTLSTLFSG